jgi:hypothetical protein
MTGTDLCVNKSQFVSVIFEPPCIYVSFTPRIHGYSINSSLFGQNFSYIDHLIHFKIIINKRMVVRMLIIPFQGRIDQSVEIVMAYMCSSSNILMLCWSTFKSSVEIKV